MLVIYPIHSHTIRIYGWFISWKILWKTPSYAHGMIARATPTWESSKAHGPLRQRAGRQWTGPGFFLDPSPWTFWMLLSQNLENRRQWPEPISGTTGCLLQGIQSFFFELSQGEPAVIVAKDGTSGTSRDQPIGRESPAANYNQIESQLDIFCCPGWLLTAPVVLLVGYIRRLVLFFYA